MKASRYERCRCPGCRARLDDVFVDAAVCPHCNAALVPREVWRTRSYAGAFELPGWVAAFGWPMVLIVVGVVWMAGSYYASGRHVIYGPAGLIGVGVVMFFAKLFTNGDA